MAMAALVVALVVWLVLPAGMKSARLGDYEPQVRNLMAGRGFVAESGEVMDRYPPLYPLILWGLLRVSDATGVSEKTLYGVFAAGCVAATAWLVWSIAGLLGAGGGAWAAAAAFCLHPFVLFGLALPLSETPFALALAGAVWLALKGLRGNSWRAVWLSAAAGALCGVACLLRPFGVFAPFVLAVAVTGSRWKEWNGVRRALPLLGAFFLIVSPWEVFVWAKTGKWVVLSTGGPATLRDGLSFNHKAMRSRLRLPAGVEWMSDEAWLRYRELDTAEVYLSFVAERFVERPWAVAQTYAFKAARAWYGTDSQNARLEVFNAGVSAVFLTGAGMGIWRFRKRRGGLGMEGWTLVGLALGAWAMTTVVLSIARYMMPMAAVLAPFYGFLWGGGGQQ